MTLSFLNGCLLFGVLVTSESFGLGVTTQLPNYIIPEHYDIKLHLDALDNDYFYGTCHISIKINRPMWNMSLQAQMSQIEIQLLVLNKINSSSIFIPHKKYTFNNKSHTLDIQFADKVSHGSYVLEIEYKAALNNGEGLFKSSYINEEGINVWLVATYYHIIGTQPMFPCWNDPAFNATFNISISHRSEYIALSNMPVREEYTRHGLTSTHFYKTPRMFPYYIAIMVSNFPSISVERINLQCRKQTASHLKYAKMVIENVTQHLESQWSRCNELAKADHIAIPDFHHESINNLELVFYRETALIYNEKLDPVIRKIDVARLVGREVAHQCFNNLISSSSLSQLWLKEGIFTLYAADALSKIYPDLRILDLFVVQIQHESLRLDSHFVMKPPVFGADSTKINSLLSFYYYIKAPAILRMLQHALGDEVFWKGIKVFLNNRKYKNPSNFDDLWTAMQVPLNKLNNNNFKFDIKSKMNNWTQLKYYPVLDVTQFDPSYVKISIESALDQSVEIPLTFTTQDNSNFTNTRPYFFLWVLNTFDYIFLPLNTSGWIIMNIQQAGYYRVNYDAIYWDRIVHYLKTSHEYTKIHVLNRAQLIDDAFYFLINGKLSLSTFLELTKYLQRETDFIAWYPMIKALEYISGFFLFEESAHLKVHMRDILHKLLNNITYTEKSDEKPHFIKSLRQEAAKWACIFNDTACKFAVTVKLTLHLDNIERLDPEWMKWAYCNGLVNNDVWWNVFDTWVNKADNKLLEYLPCSTSFDIVRNYLNIIVNKSESCGSKLADCNNVKMQPKDRANSFLLTVAKHAKDNKVLEYILQNFEKIRPREVSMSAALVNIINHLQSKNQLNKVLEFVKDYNKRTKEIIITINFNSMLDNQEKLYRKAYEDINKFLKHNNVPILIVQQKIDARVSEIENQLNHFQDLILN